MEKSEIAKVIELIPRILVVDDDENFRKTMCGIIRKLGDYEVTPIENAETTIKEVKKNFYHLAIIDLKLKGTEDGLHLAEKLRAINPFIGLILMTGHANLDIAIESIKRGIDAFFVKPPEFIELRLSIAQVLTKRRLILEREKLIQELRYANDKLKDLDRLKTRFISMVSHELKTPLTTILGYSSCLINIRNDAKLVESISKIIDREGKHLARLIDDLLDVTGIVAKKFKIYKKESTILEILKISLEEVKFKFQEKNISLTKKFDSNLPKKVIADLDRIAQVVTILLNNAYEHTPTGGNVEIKVYKRDEDLYVEVKDTGEGIEKDEIPHLFEYFYQSESHDHSRKYKGLGLGLAIAKEIIAKHNGIIKAESMGKSKGSRFYFIIPIKNKNA